MLSALQESLRWVKVSAHIFYPHQEESPMTYRHLSTLVLVACVAIIYGQINAAHHKKNEQQSDMKKKKTVTISDANLRAVIEDSLKKESGAMITAADMVMLQRLEAPNAEISDLSGLEHATNLMVLNLGEKRVDNKVVNSNTISDLAPLSGLTKLRNLRLARNAISDISPLSGLTGLRTLNLNANRQISDISHLSGLTKLKNLNLTRNKISDVSSLSGLTELRILALGFNKAISDVSPLSGLTELRVLNLRNCSISDLSPLAANAGLSGDKDTVDLRGNLLNDASTKTHIPALEKRGVKLRVEN